LRKGSKSKIVDGGGGRLRWGDNDEQDDNDDNDNNDGVEEGKPGSGSHFPNDEDDYENGDEARKKKALSLSLKGFSPYSKEAVGADGVPVEAPDDHHPAAARGFSSLASRDAQRQRFEARHAASRLSMAEGAPNLTDKSLTKASASKKG